MPPDTYNPYRANMDDEHIRKHYGIASRAALLAATVVFSSLVTGAVLLLITLITAWIKGA